MNVKSFSSTYLLSVLPSSPFLHLIACLLHMNLLSYSSFHNIYSIHVFALFHFFWPVNNYLIFWFLLWFRLQFPGINEEHIFRYFQSYGTDGKSTLLNKVKKKTISDMFIFRCTELKTCLSFPKFQSIKIYFVRRIYFQEQ